ncbi:uncharacterized protein LOC130715680 isoform X2 [Lotus japonicus]|uniref:uncharacterized protein LOC130715680 isoform X2 n=1 Tax=Lotus japonicus TaxID=34305 RepID=UPI0025835A3E|nr:uncharacterized protein LOC130715680 isoform X2 [Lotus japonicus]XP_057421778.1 uncharacterized protein LOC130715680 isoform X2 [Lotus japonicus]
MMTWQIEHHFHPYITYQVLGASESMDQTFLFLLRIMQIFSLVNKITNSVASPKQIIELMQVEDLTNGKGKSHLQVNNEHPLSKVIVEYAKKFRDEEKPSLSEGEFKDVKNHSYLFKILMLMCK